MKTWGFLEQNKTASISFVMKANCLPGVSRNEQRRALLEQIVKMCTSKKHRYQSRYDLDGNSGIFLLLAHDKVVCICHVLIANWSFMFTGKVVN